MTKLAPSDDTALQMLHATVPGSSSNPVTPAFGPSLRPTPAVQEIGIERERSSTAQDGDGGRPPTLSPSGIEWDAGNGKGSFLQLLLDGSCRGPGPSELGWPPSGLTFSVQGEASSSSSSSSSSPRHRLTVRVIEARNLLEGDLWSKADPYVVLRLPLASGTKLRTQTVTNSSHPVWNEAFHFQIQSLVKNILELQIYDADSVSSDDALFTVLFDVTEVQAGQLLRKTFSLNPPGAAELEVEMLVEETTEPPENLLTNGVLVARELTCLDVRLDRESSTAALSGEDRLELTLEGSYEGCQDVALGPAPAGPLHFHYVMSQETELSGQLRSSSSGSGGGEEDPANILTVPLGSLCHGAEVTASVPAPNDTALRLQLKADDCPGELSVRLGFELCTGERAFLSRRKHVVAEALKRLLQLEEDLPQDQVPVVGVMAVGGGPRAMTSLYGHLSALQHLDLLDCVTYISGTSGSTWTMASLYGDADWSRKGLEKPIGHARRHMTKSKLATFSPSRLSGFQREMGRRAGQGHPPSCVDLWGLVLEFLLHGQVTEQKLSEQRQALDRGQNPLPLYLGLNVKEDNLGTLDFKEWVEFSPYEVGILKYGAFVPPELFGSEFFMGRLMKRLPESRICFLEGLWSNVFSVNLLDAWYDLTCSDEAWKEHIRNKTGNIEKEPPGSHHPEGSWLRPGESLAQAFQGFLTGRPLNHRSHNFLRGLQLHRGYCGHPDFRTWKDCQLDSVPTQLTPQQPQLCLVDAAYFINTSCPLLLRPGRGLDLILSFGYALNSPFEALEQTERYCREQGIPFPAIKLTPEERLWPRECHVFSDPACPDAPIVLHFPLVNDSFRQHSAPGVRRSPEELEGGQVDLEAFLSPYSLLNMTYSEEDFDRLLRLSEYNVCNSRSIILQALRSALGRRRRP
ncbi:cytosolic phospholipase A2 delta [Tachyglossus aculeatus]|uniref:cytosolic phospholipase A2 delta n=1 Tax=Tachyglossus aculeatus TaxID=9261 RepID=UPI0018F37BC2|nr:cytosolic phospholipase A2 delta [Tachyglossus aculeatus]